MAAANDVRAKLRLSRTVTPALGSPRGQLAALLAALLTTGCAVADSRPQANAPSRVAAREVEPEFVSRPPQRQSEDETCAPKPLWRFHAGSPLAGQPAIGAEGQICVVTTEGLAHLLDPTGGFLWSYTLAFGAAAGPALSRRGNCYVGTAGRRFYSISPRGVKRWERRRLARPGSDLVPRPGGGFSYLGARGGLHVFSAEGTDVWHTSMAPRDGARERGVGADRGSAGPAWADRGTAVVGTEGGRVLTVRDAKVRHERRIGSDGSPVMAVIASDDVVYAVVGDTLVALDGALEERWRHPDVQFVSASPGAGVVAVSADGLVTQLSPAGDTVMTWPASQPSAAAVLTEGGWLFVPRLDGRIALFPPSVRGQREPEAKREPLLTDRLANSGFQTPLHEPSRGRAVFAADSGEILAFSLQISADDPCASPSPSR